MDPKIVLETTLRDEARAIFRQQLGQLRSIASQMRAKGLVEDEEEAFNELLTQFTGCFTGEICRLVGTEIGAQLLDPFIDTNNNEEFVKLVTERFENLNGKSRKA